MSYTLTDEQFERLLAYFELCKTAISDDEQDKLLDMEGPLRDMLREIKASRQ
jgi:hypothetical protein